MSLATIDCAESFCGCVSRVTEEHYKIGLLEFYQVNGSALTVHHEQVQLAHEVRFSESRCFRHTSRDL